MINEYKKIIRNKCKELDDQQVDAIYYYLSDFRYVKDEFFYYPENLLDNLFCSQIKHSLVYYPSDVISLRNILNLKKPNNSDCICVFSFEFAKKHFLDYPILLGYEVETEDYGNLSIAKEGDFKLKRIFIREEYLNTEVYKTILCIIQDEKIQVDISTVADIPMLRPKIAQNFNLKQAQQETSSIQIKLNTREQQIFDLLISVKNSNPRLSNVEMRVAGGWVRDKLMGNESDDIDIALSNVSGVHFAQSVKVFAQQQGIKDVGKIYSTSLDKTGNALESANLEVAAIDLFGQKVEFVNLRTETYNENSRVPIQTITNDPAEDAKRRDLTINALYYNIETRKVEDYVNGLQDFEMKPDGKMYPKIIRTPADPNNQQEVNKIYEDDPLRLLRALRFMSRYEGTQLHPTIINAMKDENVLKFYDKLKPERSSKEIRKLMEGNNPVEATRILLETGLYKKVFQIPEKWHDISISQQNPFHNLSLREHTLQVMKNFNNMAKKSNMSDHERGLMMLSTLLHDFGKMHPDIRQPKIDKKTGKPETFDQDGTTIERMTYIGHDEESAKFAKEVMTRMGFEPKEKKFVETVVFHHMTPHEFKADTKPKHLGKFLYEVGELYDKVMTHAHADALSKQIDPPEEEVNKINSERQQSLDRLNQYKQEVGNAIYKTLIDGNKIKEIVNTVAPDMVKANGMITIGGKKQHFMTILVDQLLEQQWAKRVKTVEDAEKFIMGQSKSLLDMWKKEERAKNQPITENVKKASMGQVDKEYDVADQNALERNSGQVFMKYYIDTKYTTGKRVRLHPGGTNEGLAYAPIEGRIVSSNNNKIVIEWTSGKYKGKRAGFDLTDAISMAKLEIIN